MIQERLSNVHPVFWGSQWGRFCKDTQEQLSESIRYSINPKNKWFLQKGNPIQNSKKANCAFNVIHIHSWFQVATNFSVLEIASGFSFSASPSMLYTCSRRSWTLFSVFLAMNLKFFSLSWNDNSLQTSEWPVSVPTSTNTRGSL